MYRLTPLRLGRILTAAASMALVVSIMAPVSSAVGSAASGSPPQWAYGFSGSSSQSGATSIVSNSTVTGPHNLSFEFSQHAAFGWDVIVTQRNLSSTAYELELQRTMAFTYSAVLCYPSCSTPVFEGNLSSGGAEVATAFANLTSTGRVWEGSVQVPALALIDENAAWHGNLTDHATYTFQRMGLTLSGSQTLSLVSAAHLGVTFAPPLGLVPNNLSAGKSWNSSSVFHASGAWSVVGTFTGQTPNGTQTSRSIASNGSVNGSGAVGLAGHAGTALRLDDGSDPLVILLELTGPFSDREGVILLPSGGDLFAGPHSFTSAGASQQSVSTANLDFAAATGPHVGLEASSTAYSAGPVGSGSAVGVGLTAAAPSASPTAVFQGQPESVPQAEEQSACLLGGPCPSVGSGVTPGIGSPAAWWGAGLSVAAAAAVIGLVVARRRPARLPRRLTESPLAPRRGPPATSPAMPPSDPSTTGPDPLDRLW
ncbi:MAG TPA: hypothetical protein VFF67_09380 [Thermoplasmata archaeon]|nr:hypothetical protein [Thermoplasmata archaeon]